jgi:hypothetical protein
MVVFSTEEWHKVSALLHGLIEKVSVGANKQTGRLG